MGEQLDKLRQVYDAYSQDSIFESFRRRGANFVPGRGHLKPDIMIIGEKPGPEEDERGLPFVGKTGIELDILLKGSDINPEDVFFTCVMKYGGPSYSDEVKDRSYFYIEQEIEAVNPVVIGLAGVQVTQMFFPDIEELGPYNGKLLDDRYVPVYSPSAMIHSFSRRHIYRKGYAALKLHSTLLKVAS